jgi:hypothetical protein
MGVHWRSRHGTSEEEVRARTQAIRLPLQVFAAGTPKAFASRQPPLRLLAGDTPLRIFAADPFDKLRAGFAVATTVDLMHRKPLMVR